MICRSNIIYRELTSIIIIIIITMIIITVDIELAILVGQTAWVKDYVLNICTTHYSAVENQPIISNIFIYGLYMGRYVEETTIIRITEW